MKLICFILLEYQYYCSLKLMLLNQTIMIELVIFAVVT